MKAIGIICATDEELQALENIMSEKKDRKYFYDICFISGKIEKKNVVLVKCGIGKVNAARTTQILIDKFEIEYVINVGVAGGLSYKANIGDIVVAKNLVQHDFDITAFGHSKGYIPGVGNVIDTDKSLVDKFEKCFKYYDQLLKEKSSEISQVINKEKYKLIIGTIATGDVFVTSQIEQDEINLVFKADACEMEGGAIAQICYLDKVPFIVIRSISDTPNGNNNVEYDKFLEMACNRVSSLIKIFCNLED